MQPSCNRHVTTVTAACSFGADIIVAPIVAPAGEPKGDPSQTLARKTTWLPPGTWYDGLTGEVSVVSAEAGVNHTRGYTLGEVPMWFKGGAVVPYIPLKSLPSLVGVATKQVIWRARWAVWGRAALALRTGR